MDLRLRLKLAGLIALFPLIPLSLRLAQLQILDHAELKEKASDEYDRTAQEVLPRGSILDRFGNPLARSVLSWSAFVDLSMVKDRRALARRLSPLLAIPDSMILAKMKDAKRFPTIRTDMNFSQKEALAKAKIGEVGIVQQQKRVYPNGDLARSLLGAVNKAERGTAGLELTFDRELTGESAKREVFRDGTGQTIYRRSASQGLAPVDLKLTIDRSAQFYAEEFLSEAVAKHSLNQGIVAVQDPGTGEILALASWPPNPMKNIAAQDTMEPGSTIKVIAAAAAIEEKVIGESETVFCENGQFEIAPKVRINDHEPAGDLTLAQILERSSNIGIAKVAQRLGPARFYRYCQAFGLSTKTGLPLPGETAGVLPTGDRGNLRYLSASFGYGLGVSALQMLAAYSAIANGGALLEPSLIASGAPPVVVRRVASEKSIATLRGYLEGVVERGTGVPAKIPGYTVAGKTGTARKLDPDGKYSSSRYTASFIGFVPARSPKFTILVILDEPKGQNYYGSQVAAPVFSGLGRRLLALKGVAPDAPSPPLTAAVGAPAPRVPAGPPPAGRRP